MAELTLEIATPERLLLSEKVSEVEVPGKDGYMDFLPGHAPLISELAAGGVLRYVASGKTVYLSVLGGFVEVLDDRVLVLADGAVRREEIDVEKARAQLAEAQRLINNPSDIDPAQALEDALRAQALIDTASR
jgi:F-type H+-transporting ATPase subunit epsilon